MELEIWKIKSGYSNYEISNFGNVRSVSRSYYNKAGSLINVKTKVLKFGLDKDGYYYIILKDDFDKSKYFRVQRLVAELFVENVDNLPIVNHLDNNRLNNHYLNLEWTTQKGNMQHALKSGNMEITIDIFKKLRNTPGYSLKKPVIQMDLNNNILNVYESKSLAADIIGVSACAISQACVGNTNTCGGYKWCYLTDKEYKGEIICRNVEPQVPVIQIDIDGSIINCFKSISSAAKFIGRDPKGIRDACSGKCNTCGGYKWKYKEVKNQDL